LAATSGSGRPLLLRHSRATERAARSPASARSILVALAANVVIAAAKLVAGLITGSAALLAEAMHSTADSLNEVMLGVSLRRARRPADDQHPFGYGRERFLWAFLAAILSFLIGGCLSIVLAVHDLLHGAEVGHFAVAWVVLGVAALADGSSLLQTLRQARREAAFWDGTTIDYLRYTSDPTLRALAVEDAAALVGVAIAAGGLLIHQLGGPASSDSIASLLIGVLLGATAIGLARPLADLLIGKSIASDRLRIAHSILSGSPGIEQVLTMYAAYAGPQEAILGAKVHPAAGQTGEQLAELLDELDQRLREALPEIGEVFIDATANRLPTDAS
jgi:cation diffusion facilitator family transporter